MVWMLGVAGASELLHDEVHEHEHTEEHSCAITLFAHGVEPAVPGAPPVLRPHDAVVETLRLAAVEAHPAADRPLRPGRDPPQA